METFPTIFPSPSVSFSGTMSVPTARTTMESGRVRQRARATRVNRLYRVEWEMDEIQFGCFQSFHWFKLNQGQDWFLISLPVGAGDGLQLVRARMVEGDFAAKYQPVSHWSVQASLEVETITLFSETLLDVYIAAGGSGSSNPPLTQSFNVPLTAGEESKVVNFPVSFGAFGPPPAIKLQLVAPLGGFSFEVILQAGWTATGFTMNFGSVAIPGPGYSVNVIASFTIP